MPITNDLCDLPPWLLLVFSLPARRASQRVEIWRKLQRFGALALPSSGYLLPNNSVNQENLEWLATAIRNYKGKASVLQVQRFDDLPDKQLRQLFLDERSRDYQGLLRDLKAVLSVPQSRRSAAQLGRLRRRFQQASMIDFFDNPLRGQVETLLTRADEPESPKLSRKSKQAQFMNRVWMTRRRPGIDRVSSAWLIRRFIDPKARFAFGSDPSAHPDSIPFDMFSEQGFGHRGENCTFETLCKEFGIHASKVKRIAQIIHDADLEDEMFGRTEGEGLDRVLKGWAQQDIDDHELLRRGMELIEGLYHGLV
jgi:hypothetical protein